MQSQLVEDASKIMKEQPEMISGVEELAERLGVSKSHLIRAFKSKYDVSPGKFLEHEKINRAKLILCNSDYNIETTAYMCGYSCANYFCKVFKKAVGQTPAVYRKKQASYVDETTRKKITEIEGRFHV